MYFSTKQIPIRKLINRYSENRGAKYEKFKIRKRVKQGNSLAHCYSSYSWTRF
jgi:hypothetical protein